MLMRDMKSAAPSIKTYKWLGFEPFIPRPYAHWQDLFSIVICAAPHTAGGRVFVTPRQKI